MFFNLVYRNAKRSRQENLIYFATLVTAVASFYLILSLERQDVILYLKDFESDAVDRLFTLMPILYFIALFLLFFLVLFANRYQLDRRSKEFGMYLMLGMKQQKLFFLLLAEGVLTSFVALGSGILVGGILAEGISLTTARLIGQGIIAHQLSFSFEAALYTAAGFLLIQLVALLLLAIQLFRRELHTLLRGQVDKKQAMGNVQGNWLTLLLGVAVLGVAYWLVIRYFWIVNYPMVFLAVILGTIGTILVIRGVARILNALALRSNRSNGLATFTVRQLQENITNRSTAIAVSSILMMLSLIMLAEGASTIMSSSEQLQRGDSVYDFTVQGEAEAVQTFLTSEKMASYVADLNPMELGIAADELSFDWSTLRLKIVEQLPEGVEDPAIENPGSYSIDETQSDAENLLGIVDGALNRYFIRESSYNRLLETAGEETIDLAEGEVALYLNTNYIGSESPLLQRLLMEAQLDQEALLSIDGKPFSILPVLPIKSLVTDSSITLMTALVVPDDFFEASVPPIRREIYWNFQIPAELTEEEGLMMPIKAASDLLSTTEFSFESYLQNFGRHLFYIIAGSYTMLYLSFLFLLIGCTVLALQFLTQLKQTKRRYQTLAFLGSNRNQMNRSIRKQILWYFLFPLIPALVSGTVGIVAMKTYIRFNADFLPSIGKMLPFVLLMVGLFLLVQWIYATAVYRTAIKEIEQQTFK